MDDLGAGQQDYMRRQAEENALASQYMNARPPFRPGQFNTSLPFLQEMQFRQWLQNNKVPFDPEAKVSDYDMRGFYQAMQSGSPMARSAINPNDNQMHYPDYWKTPLHQTFSNESQWAGPNTPGWINDSQLASPGGRILHDERAQPSPLEMFARGRR